MEDGEKSEGEKVGNRFDSAKDCKISLDLDGRLKVPGEIKVTQLRPDIIITSVRTRQLTIVEIRVSREDWINISGELKKTKHSPIVEEGKQKGWSVSVWPVEV